MKYVWKNILDGIDIRHYPIKNLPFSDFQDRIDKETIVFLRFYYMKIEQLTFNSEINYSTKILETLRCGYKKQWNMKTCR